MEDKIRNSNIYKFFKEKYELTNQEIFDSVKYSVNVLCKMGFYNLIDEYLNVNRDLYDEIYIAITNKKLKLKTNLIKFHANVAYDYVFLKLREKQKNCETVNLKSPELFNGFDKFVKNYK